jgi:sugar phosphate isomerase/epimerase
MSLKLTSQNSLSRRAFLGIAGAAAGSAALVGTSAFASPFSDSAQGGKPSGKTGSVPVGIELYTVRDALKADLMGTVRGVAKMGYEVVEFYSPYYDWTPQQAKDVKKLLDDLGVKALSTHNNASVFTPEGIQKAIDLNQAIGSKCIVMASAGGKIADAAGWKAVADRLNFGAEKLAPLGMTAGFHNHAVEWQPVDGQRPMDILAKNTKKEVALQLDLGTCVEAGADPVAWINANPGRIKSLHCKEWSKEKGYEVLVGEGQVPWAGVIKAAESVGGVEFYLIEQEAGPSDQQMARAEKCLANWKKMRS